MPTMKRLFCGTLFLTLACATTGWAAQAPTKEAPKKEAKPKKQAPAPKKAAEKSPEDSATRFLYRSTQPLTVAAVIEHFRLYDREMRSLSANFRQSLQVPETWLRQSVEGSVRYLKPERLRIEHEKPERQSVVADGKDIWIFRHSQNQAIQSDLGDWKKADPAMDNLMGFGDYARMLENYDALLDTAAAAGSRAVLVLTPKTKAEEPFSLRLSLAEANLFPHITELSVGSVRVRTELSELRFNPPLEESLFRFTPPPTADVFRNFKPPKLK
mgnify:CR=1 FL=1